MSYPTTLDTLRDDFVNADPQANDHPNHHNDLADAVMAVETELGTTPSGSFTTVRERLEDIESSIGGGSGIPVSTIDAKGDLLVGSANDTIDNLPVGSNDQVLVADSSQTLGVKWAAVPGTSAFVPVATIDAKGDLLVGSANDALDNLGVGTNGHVLTADSAQTLGVKWAPAGQTTGGSVLLYDYEVTGSDKTSIDTQVDDGGNGAAALPTSYRLLEIFIIHRTDVAGATDTININVNNDTNLRYDRQVLSGANTTVAAATALGQAAWNVGSHGSGGSGSYPAVTTIVIPGYGATTFNKVGNARTSRVDATAANNGEVEQALGYTQTSAITRVAIIASGTGGAKLKVGSRLLIYAR